MGEGNGDISRPAFDYDKQEWKQEENAYKKVTLAALEASVKPEAKVLTIDSYQAAHDFMGGALDKHEFVDNLVEKAKADGYDIVNLKNVDDAKWERPDGMTDRYGNKSWYGQYSGYSGKDDYFVINKEAIGLKKGEAEPEQKTPEPNRPSQKRRPLSTPKAASSSPPPT